MFPILIKSLGQKKLSLRIDSGELALNWIWNVVAIFVWFDLGFRGRNSEQLIIKSFWALSCCNTSDSSGRINLFVLIASAFGFREGVE